MNPVALATIGCGWFNNVISSKIEKPHSLLLYVTESEDWVIKQVGIDITRYLNDQKLLRARTTTTYKGIHNQILHFGSRNLFLPHSWKDVNTSNKIIFTWYHGTERDRNPVDLAMIQALPEASKRADIVHTACLLSKERLVEWGVPEEKIVIVPIGVDLSAFKPVSEVQKQAIREKLGLPQDKIIVGSFQKDGVGWGEGSEPKWIKGPDIFIEVVHRLKRDHDVFVLLTGPSRGYVKKELDRIDVPYKHFFVKNYLEIPKFYNASDLYIVTSREEGGPKAVLESMAAGIPVVSTRVGMSPEVIRDSYNGLLAEVEDVEALSAKSKRIIENKDLGRHLVGNALTAIEDYSWGKIARQYYEDIYKRFLNK